MSLWDICVVGAGPAGLAFIHTLEGHDDDLAILVMDSGNILNVRDKTVGEDLIQGEGGAGLWSDGKFSFFPAGGPVYELHNILPAYQRLTDMFSMYEVDVPPFQNEASSLSSSSSSSVLAEEKFVQKAYPSFYLSLKEREQLIFKLSQHSLATFLFNVRMSHFTVDKDSGLIDVHLNSNINKVTCKHLVYAGGRFGPLGLPQSITTWQRVEFGVRIEVPSDLTLFNGETEAFIDPKFIHVDPESGTEYRTFCVCRNGSVVDTSFDGMWTCSGSSEMDGGIHNVGFNVRIKDPGLGHLVMQQIAICQAKKMLPFHQATFEDLQKVKGPFHFGDTAIYLIIKGLEKLREQFREFGHPDVRFSGPTLEGVGYYPDIDFKTLQLKAHRNVTVIGDSSGIFRGTIPALLSGIVVAQKFLK